MSGRRAAILPQPRPLHPPHPTPLTPLEAGGGKKTHQRKPRPPTWTGPCVRTLVCGQARVPPASPAPPSLEPVRPIPGSHCFLGSSVPHVRLELLSLLETPMTVLPTWWLPARRPLPLTVISLIFRVFSLIHFSLRTFSVALMSSLSFLISYQQGNRSQQRSCRKREDAKTPCSWLPVGFRRQPFNSDPGQSRTHQGPQSLSDESWEELAGSL